MAVGANGVAATFLSTLPRGERLSLEVVSLDKVMFLSTLPRGERHPGAGKARYGTKFLSTLPRGERLSGCRAGSLSHRVSIHAPARGATRYAPQR